MMRSNDSEVPENNACANRAEDLLSFLYGETTAEAAEGFRMHLESCEGCRAELVSLESVRGRVSEWRAEALSAAALSSAFASQVIGPYEARSHSRSAADALRAFFRLSPLWLRAATAMLLVLCAGVGMLTVFRAELRWDSNGLALTTASERKEHREQVEAEARQRAEEQIEAAVKERVALKLAALADQSKYKDEQARAAATGDERNESALQIEETSIRKKQRRGRVQNRAERPSVEAGDDDDLPRFSDLLSGVY